MSSPQLKANKYLATYEGNGSFFILFHEGFRNKKQVLIIYQGPLNKKEIQQNFCNIFSIFIFNELYLFT